MIKPGLRRTIVVILLVLALLLTVYSYFFRTYLDSEQYLQMAWDYTNHDPHILNWREPEFEIIRHNGSWVIHFTMRTDQDDLFGPYSLYIDPFKKQVVDEDPRNK